MVVDISEAEPRGLRSQVKPENEGVESSMKEISDLIRATKEKGTENDLKLAEVKSWLSEYLQEREEEIERFPKERNRDHWDMIIADSDSLKDAMFLLAFFQRDRVHILSGHGSFADLRDFGENSFPKNPAKLIDAFTLRFEVGGRISIKMADLLHWLKK